MAVWFAVDGLNVVRRCVRWQMAEAVGEGVCCAVIIIVTCFVGVVYEYMLEMWSQFLRRAGSFWIFLYILDVVCMFVKCVHWCYIYSRDAKTPAKMHTIYVERYLQ